MTSTVANLSNERAVITLQKVAEKWVDEDQFDTIAIYIQAQKRADVRPSDLPEWIYAPEADWDKAGTFARKMLTFLENPRDPRVVDWLDHALKKTSGPQAQEVASILTIGVVLIGAILAARVKRISGSGIEFYEDIPKGLADVLKAVEVFFKQ